MVSGRLRGRSLTGAKVASRGVSLAVLSVLIVHCGNDEQRAQLPRAQGSAGKGSAGSAGHGAGGEANAPGGDLGGAGMDATGGTSMSAGGDPGVGGGNQNGAGGKGGSGGKQGNGSGGAGDAGSPETGGTTSAGGAPGVGGGEMGGAGAGGEVGAGEGGGGAAGQATGGVGGVVSTGGGAGTSSGGTVSSGGAGAGGGSGTSGGGMSGAGGASSGTGGGGNGGGAGVGGISGGGGAGAGAGGTAGAGGVSGGGGAGSGAGGAAAGTGGSAGQGGGAGAGAGGAATCGNGVVDAGETCDKAIASGNPGRCVTYCPVLTACQTRLLSGNWTTCSSQCNDGGTITTVSSTPDMCCPAAGDPDCTSAYPVQDSGTDTSSKAASCGSGKNWYDADESYYLPLAPTCGVPVLLNVRTVRSASRIGANYYDADIVRKSPGSENYSYNDNVSWNQPEEMNPAGEAWYLVDMSTTEATFVNLDLSRTDCVSSTYTWSTYVDARPLPTQQVSATNPTRVVVGGDESGLEFAIEEAPAGLPTRVRVVTGRYTNSHLAGQSFDATFTVNGDVVVSTPGVSARDVTIANESTAPVATIGTAPYVHAVWVEDDGGTLLYARISGTGTVDHQRVVATGVDIATPKLVVFDDQHLGLAFVERVAGMMELEFARLRLDTGATEGTITALTSGDGDALEPDIGAHQPSGWRGVTWIDTRSGLRQIYVRPIDGSGNPGTEELVSSAAVAPEHPGLYASALGVSVGWIDSRDGYPAVYAKNDYVAAALVDNAELRVSPAGASVQAFHLGKEPTLLGSDGLLSSSELTPLVAWETTEGSYLGQLSPPYGPFTVVSGTKGLQLSCGAATAPCIGLAGRYGGSGAPAASFTAWIESGAISFAATNPIILPRVEAQ